MPVNHEQTSGSSEEDLDDVEEKEAESDTKNDSQDEHEVDMDNALDSLVGSSGELEKGPKRRAMDESAQQKKQQKISTMFQKERTH